MSNEDKKVEKIIPSILERGLQNFLYRTLGKHIPKKMTPNHITIIGAIGGLIGIICAFLAKIHMFFLFGTIAGLVCHVICDDLDGYVARTRNMTSKAGAYLDLLTDILHITFLIIGLAFSGVIDFRLAVFVTPLYAFIMFTSMNYILHLNEFLFPRLGPVETHLFFVAIAVSGIVLKGRELFAIGEFGVTLGDLIAFVGAAAMYFEAARLQVILFKRLNKLDKEEKNNEG